MSSGSHYYKGRDNESAISVQPLQMAAGSEQDSRSNQFTICHIVTGCGAYWTNDGQYELCRNSLICLPPYQRIRFQADKKITATLLKFHANFLCVETFHAEVGCGSALFNDPYGSPTISLSMAAQQRIGQLFDLLWEEQENMLLARSDAMLSLTRLLLVMAAREKAAQSQSHATASDTFRDGDLMRLKELIEANYHRLHAPRDYALLMQQTPKTLGRLVQKHFRKPLTALIRERILIHARWELLHTLKPVKQIAFELGYDDELYFSRMFRKAVGLSPTRYREFETEIRGGSNLSMTLGDSSL